VRPSSWPSSSGRRCARWPSCGASRSATVYSTRCSHGSASASERLATIVRLVSLDDDGRAELDELAGMHRLRMPRVVDAAQGPRVVIDGREVINFASNDYLGLADDRRLRRAAASALEDGGTGVGASRLIAGNHREHVRLEEAVADWLGCSGVRLFNTGYAAN